MADTKFSEDIIMRKLHELEKEIEMTKTHATNYLQMAKEYDEGVKNLEIKKLDMLAALEKLRGNYGNA